MRIRLILVLIALSIAFSAYLAYGNHRDADFKRMVEWSGCKANLITSDEESVLSSMFVVDEEKGTIYIGTLKNEFRGQGFWPLDEPDHRLTREMGMLVVFHEIGHCLQAQEGTLFKMDTVTRELDADRRGTDLMCGYGYDGRQVLKDLLNWAYDTYGYNGDSDHGTLDDRKAQGKLAYRCDALSLAP